ncbi:MAG: hypothetical protein HY812_08345 [Planctomycetes bacterium]|nr:hypothetical protein [Planctomycetota bacterium]
MLSTAALPSQPGDGAWEQAPEHVAKMLLQDMVEPRLLHVSTAEVRVRAMSDGAELAFRLEWADATVDDQAAAERFCDGCAVQLPAKAEANVPAPQMGEPGRPVEIAYWNAGWQAAVDGRGDSIQDIYPNAVVDHYPFEAKPLEGDSAAQREMAARYSPARSLGNAMAGPHVGAVQDLVAEGPGSLMPAAATTSRGRGLRTDEGWAVVITRRMPAGVSSQTRTQVALAVWEGTREEVGARKMRTGWTPLIVREKP